MPLACDNQAVAAFPFIAELVVERYLSGVRIDSFLVRHFRNYTPWRLQRIVTAGQVKIDGTTVEITEAASTMATRVSAR